MESKLETFLSKRGQFCGVTWLRDVKTRVAFKSLTVQKVVSARNIRAGVTYDNMASVQDKRESGELPAVNQGLPWGEWEIFPHVIKHKGNRYLRFALCDSSQFETTFLVNGEAKTRAEVEPMLLASELSDDTRPDVITVKESSILVLT